jgi:hypothetical protein
MERFHIDAQGLYRRFVTICPALRFAGWPIPDNAWHGLEGDEPIQATVLGWRTQV